MITSYAHELFKIFYDKVDSNSYKNFEPFEIDVFLNTAQLRVIKNHADPINKLYPGLEKNSKRTRDLDYLIKNYQVVPNPFSPENKNHNNNFRGNFCNIPEEVLYIVNEEYEVSYNDCLRRINVIPTTHDRYNKIIKNPFQEPNSEECLRLPYNSNRVEIISNIQIGTPLSYIMRYYKYPRYIYEGSYPPPTIPSYQGALSQGTAQDPELHDEIMDEVIHEAVKIALENIESQRLGTHVQLNTE